MLQVSTVRGRLRRAVACVAAGAALSFAAAGAQAAPAATTVLSASADPIADLLADPIGNALAGSMASLVGPRFGFGNPVPGHAINSPFGLRKMSWEKEGRLHRGVDIAAPMGSPVVAVAEGVVLRSGVSPSYGRFVEVQHAEGLISFYAHLSAISPQAALAGQVLKSGAAIGQVGSTGRSTGPHLHFEMRHAGDSLNPAEFLGRTFAQAGDLPIRAAAFVSPHVRVVQGAIAAASAKAAPGRGKRAVQLAANAKGKRARG